MDSELYKALVRQTCKKLLFDCVRSGGRALCLNSSGLGCIKNKRSTYSVGADLKRMNSEHSVVPRVDVGKGK